MMTWRLWRALLHGYGSPILFKRVYVGQSLYLGWTPAYTPPSPLTWRQRALRALFSGLSSILIWLGGIGMILGLLCLLPLIVLLFLLEGVYFGGRCALDTGERIANERDKGTYELLCVTPAGRFGVNWSLCTGYLRHYELFDISRRVLFYLSASIIFGTVAVSLWSLVGQVISPDEFSPESALIVPQMINLAALSLAFYFNFVQSVVIGCLMGMLMPTYTYNRLDTQLVILLGYFLVLAATVLIAFLSIIMSSIFFDGIVWMIAPFVNTGILYGWRELAIRILWRCLIDRLDATPYDVEINWRRVLC